MTLSDALEIAYLDVYEGLTDESDDARYVPHMRPTGLCLGCASPVYSERACDYCGTRES